MNLADVINKASALSSQGQLDAAITCYTDWLASSTSEQNLRFAAFFNVGTLLQSLGKIDEAISAYQESLKLKPDFAEASVNLGLALEAKKSPEAKKETMLLSEVMAKADELSAQGNHDAAISCYQDWLASPESELPLRYAAFFNLGVIFRNAERTDDAIVAFRNAIALKSDCYQAAVNLGLALEAKGLNKEAVQVWKDALQPADAQILLLKQIGRLQETVKEFEDAENHLQRSLLLESDHPDVIQHYLYIRQKQCKWPVISALPGISEEFLLNYCGPLGILAFTEDPALQRRIVEGWVGRNVPKDSPRLSPVSGYNHDKLRVGYISYDFRWHAVSILTAEIFEQHDRERFEVYGIDYSVDDGGSMRKRVIGAMDHHLPIHTLSDEDAAKLIRENEIDILIDLTGLTAGARPNILSYKPAPIQISYLGFVGTCTMPQVDYILADKFVFPEELAEHFVEKPLYLPEVYQSNDSTRVVGSAPSRASCNLPKDAFVYCSFNGNYKITPEVFAVWVQILKRVPNSVLWLIADNEWAKLNLRNAAKLQGVDESRLIFAERVPPADYLARYRAADLLLDTSPYNAGTTASDALWAGLPVLTCPGRAFASRMAGSLLNAVGLNDLIASDWKEYEDIAVKMAQNPEVTNDCKQRLEKAKKSSPLFNSKRFVSNLEDVLLGIRKTSDSSEKAISNKQKSTSKKKKHKRK